MRLQGGVDEVCDEGKAEIFGPRNPNCILTKKIKFQRVCFYGWFLDHANVARRSLLMGDKV